MENNDHTQEALRALNDAIGCTRSALEELSASPVEFRKHSGAMYDLVNAYDTLVIAYGTVEGMVDKTRPVNGGNYFHLLGKECK